MSTLKHNIKCSHPYYSYYITLLIYLCMHRHIHKKHWLYRKKFSISSNWPIVYEYRQHEISNQQPHLRTHGPFGLCNAWNKNVLHDLHGRFIEFCACYAQKPPSHCLFLQIEIESSLNDHIYMYSSEWTIFIMKILTIYSIWISNNTYGRHSICM